MSATQITPEALLAERVNVAHGAIGSLAWILVFPVGAIIIRLVPSSRAWLIHAGVMSFGLVLFFINTTMGLWRVYTHLKGAFVGKYLHTAVGMVVFALVCTQPISGVLHHYWLKKYDRRTISSTIHVFLGRILVLLGMINGGLGLALKGDASKAQNTAYGVLCGIIYVTYILASLYFEARKDKRSLTKGRESPLGAERDYEKSETE